MRPIGRLTPPCSAGKQVRALMRLSRRRSLMTRVARLARKGVLVFAARRPLAASKRGRGSVPRRPLASTRGRGEAGTTADRSAMASDARACCELRRLRRAGPVPCGRCRPAFAPRRVCRCLRSRHERRTDAPPDASVVRQFPRLVGLRSALRRVRNRLGRDAGTAGASWSVRGAGDVPMLVSMVWLGPGRGT
jgi:hypothetical protein